MALNGWIRLWLLCSLLPFGGWADDVSEELLSTLKRRSIQLQRQKVESDAASLALEWLNPVTIGYSDSRNDQYDRTQKRSELVVSVDQPIFKSGGIWAALRYADATKEAGRLQVEVTRRQLIKEAIATLLNYRINTLRIRKQKLLIENDRLDIERKKEQYLSGDLDSGFLDQAILKKNQDTLQLYTLQDTRAQLRKQFADLSDVDPESIEPPRFTLMTKSEFLARHIDLLSQKASLKQSRYMRTMTLSRYLPVVSVQASYIKPYTNSYLFYSGTLPGMTDAYMTYGFRVSLPLDPKSYFEVESARLAYLQARTALLDGRRQAANLYEASLKRLDVLQKMVELSEEDERLYASLVESTKEKVEAGELTEYDLKTMENSRTIRTIDKQIFLLQKQLVLLDLYEKSYR